MNKRVEFIDWGLIDYQDAWTKQEAVFDQTVTLKIQNRTNNTALETPNYLIFCEHPHVYTLGKSGKPENLLLDEEGLKEKAATYYKINRGGDITYHGPGQIVGYPILDLDNFFTDIHLYLRTLEEAVILTLADYGIKAGRYAGFTGVWLDADNERARKICAMGVRCSRWVTMHGFAFNVNANLDYFKNIVPCGIDDKDVTSMQRELGYALDMEEVKGKLKQHISDLFGMSLTISTKDNTPLTYLALGDSYTIGESVSQSASFPYQLQARLKAENLTLAEPKIIATTGWTTDELNTAIQQANLKSRFDFVTLLIGVNNQYRGYPLDTYKKEFSALLQTAINFAGGNKSRVFVLSIPDWGKTPFGINSSRNIEDIASDIDLFNAVCKGITVDEGVNYLDITPISRRGLAEPDLVAADDLHPSKEMYAEWTGLLLPQVVKALK